MTTIGPTLPPHLTAKRKRSEEDIVSPSIPSKRSRSSSPSSPDSKPRRVIGPTVPPAPLSELPPSEPVPEQNSSKDKDHSSSSDDDDDFGPSLPPAPGSQSAQKEAQRQQRLDAEFAAREASKKPQREEWMLAPPSSSDWGSRIDPTKPKNRKFNTGKGSKARGAGGTAGSGEIDTLWTETPEQKRQRLEDEVLGVKKPAQLGPTEDSGVERRREEERKATEKRIREFNEKSQRGGSLLEGFQSGVLGKEGREKEDDPSKRAFDREKDVGLGVKIGQKAKGDMINRAKDFGGRFAKGSYL